MGSGAHPKARVEASHAALRDCPPQDLQRLSLGPPLRLWRKNGWAGEGKITSVGCDCMQRLPISLENICAKAPAVSGALARLPCSTANAGARQGRRCEEVRVRLLARTRVLAPPPHLYENLQRVDRVEHEADGHAGESSRGSVPEDDDLGAAGFPRRSGRRVLP